MIADPGFGLFPCVSKAYVIGCFAAAMNEAEDEFKFFAHVKRLKIAGSS